jgi:hypothetical protein
MRIMKLVCMIASAANSPIMPALLSPLAADQADHPGVCDGSPTTGAPEWPCRIGY